MYKEVLQGSKQGNDFLWGVLEGNEDKDDDDDV